MINFDELDKSRFHLGLQYGDSLIAKKIIKYSKRYAPHSERIPTHGCVYVYRADLNAWWVYESHLKGFSKLGVPSGVRRMPLEKWLQIEKDELEQFVAVPLDIDFKQLEELVGHKYGKGDIAALMLAAIKNGNGKQKDHKGIYCTEYIAMCYPQICDFYKLPPWCITPAHFQNYIEVMGIYG
jgi:hypothetical protein